MYNKINITKENSKFLKKKNNNNFIRVHLIVQEFHSFIKKHFRTMKNSQISGIKFNWVFCLIHTKLITVMWL